MYANDTLRVLLAGVWRYPVSHKLPTHRPETDHQRHESARREIYELDDIEFERVQ